VGAAACLSVNALDVDDAEGVARYDTSLVEREAVLLLSLGLIHEALGDVCGAIDYSICLVLDFHLLLACQTLEMSDI